MNVENTRLTAGYGFFQQFRHALVAVSQRLQKHRQINPGNRLDVIGGDDLANRVARRGAVNISQNQDTFILIQLSQLVASSRQHIGWVVTGRQIKVFQRLGTPAKNKGRTLNKAFAEIAVGDDEESDHGLKKLETWHKSAAFYAAPPITGDARFMSPLLPRNNLISL